MAIFTRVNGDAQGVVNVDKGRLSGNIVCTGLTKNPTCLLIQANTAIPNAEFLTGGAVETILRQIAIDSTVVMYQGEAVGSGNLSVLVEASGAGNATTSVAAAIEARINAIGGSASVGANIGLASAVWADTITVTDTGFNLLA